MDTTTPPGTIRDTTAALCMKAEEAGLGYAIDYGYAGFAPWPGLEHEAAEYIAALARDTPRTPGPECAKVDTT